MHALHSVHYLVEGFLPCLLKSHIQSELYSAFEINYLVKLTFYRFDNHPVASNSTNWIADGAMLTTREAYLHWFYRSFGQILGHFTRQMPSWLKPQLDLAALAQVISILDEDGERIHAEPWLLGPGSEEYVEEFGCTRSDVTELWAEHIKKHSMFISQLGYASVLGMHIYKTLVNSFSYITLGKRKIDSLRETEDEASVDQTGNAKQHCEGSSG